MLHRYVFFVLLTMCCVSAAGQSNHKPQETHGTVNIALANSNGLVLETDSLLSSRNGYPILQAGRKLYQADNHTIYMIASFFSDLGPQLPSGAYPANTVIQSLILRYIHNKDPKLTISQQLDEFGQYVAFQLAFVTRMHNAVDQSDPCRPGSGCSSMITIAGYENGKAVIGHIDVIPTTKDNSGFSTANKTIDVVDNRLTYKVYAMKDVAFDVLQHPDRVGNNDPVLSRFRRSMKKDDGASLTLEELKMLASRLEQMTARTYPRVVGGTEEIATLHDGVVQSFHSLNSNEYELTGDEYSRLMIGLVDGGGGTGSCAEGKDHPRGVGIDIPQNANGIVLINHANFKCILQSVDKLVVTNTKFDSCVLWYRGDPLSFFGENNIIIDSILSVDPRVSLRSPYIEQFRKTYPDVKIDGGKSD